MLGVSLDLSPVGIHKSLRVTQASTEERLELVLRDWDRGLYVMSLLVLLPAEADLVPEERCSKKNLGRPRGSIGCKVALILLTKAVAVHVGLSAIYARGVGFQLLPEHLGDDGSWDESRSRSGNRNESSSLWNGLKNPLQVIFRVLGNISISEKLWPWGSFRLFENFWLGRWRRVRGSNGGSNGESNRGSNGGSGGESNGGTLPVGTSTALDWDHLGAGADFLLKTLF